MATAAMRGATVFNGAAAPVYGVREVVLEGVPGMVPLGRETVDGCWTGTVDGCWTGTVDGC
ncbi:uncharacterized protein MYCFIDRAFT_183325, partial [Pseudocercospora fijiensis CIRAD86]